jgi:hypothetical protein
VVFLSLEEVDALIAMSSEVFGLPPDLIPWQFADGSPLIHEFYTMCNGAPLFRRRWSYARRTPPVTFRPLSRAVTSKPQSA